MSHEKSIDESHLLNFLFSASVSHGKYQHTSENKYWAEHWAKLNSNITISIFFGYCRFNQNAPKSEWNSEWVEFSMENGHYKLLLFSVPTHTRLSRAWFRKIGIWFTHHNFANFRTLFVGSVQRHGTFWRGYKCQTFTARNLSIYR